MIFILRFVNAVYHCCLEIFWKVVERIATDLPLGRVSQEWRGVESGEYFLL